MVSLDYITKPHTPVQSRKCRRMPVLFAACVLCCTDISLNSSAVPLGTLEFF